MSLNAGGTLCRLSRTLAGVLARSGAGHPTVDAHQTVIMPGEHRHVARTVIAKDTRVHAVRSFSRCAGRPDTSSRKPIETARSDWHRSACQGRSPLPGGHEPARLRLTGDAGVPHFDARHLQLIDAADLRQYHCTTRNPLIVFSCARPSKTERGENGDRPQRQDHGLRQDLAHPSAIRRAGLAVTL